MRLSSDAKRLYADFFEESGLCPADNFPRVRVYSGNGAKLITGLLLVDAITLGSSIYVNPKYVRRSKGGRLIISKQLLAHEIVHVIQYKNEGIAGFLSNYISDFWRGFRGNEKWTAKTYYESYLGIPHEIEARKFATEFKPWLKSRKSGY